MIGCPAQLREATQVQIHNAVGSAAGIGKWQECIGIVTESAARP